MIKNETWAPFIVATSGTKIKCNARGNETSLSEILILFMQPYCMSFTTPIVTIVQVLTLNFQRQVVWKVCDLYDLLLCALGITSFFISFIIIRQL